MSASNSKSDSQPNNAWNALVKKYTNGPAQNDDSSDSDLTDSAV